MNDSIISDITSSSSFCDNSNQINCSISTNTTTPIVALNELTEIYENKEMYYRSDIVNVIYEKQSYSTISKRYSVMCKLCSIGITASQATTVFLKNHVFLYCCMNTKKKK